jgi:hypothetical protein
VAFSGSQGTVENDETYYIIAIIDIFYKKGTITNVDELYLYGPSLHRRPDEGQGSGRNRQRSFRHVEISTSRQPGHENGRSPNLRQGDGWGDGTAFRRGLDLHRPVQTGNLNPHKRAASRTAWSMAR